MNESELGRLVIRIVGDSTSFVRTAASAATVAGRTAALITQHTNAVERGLNSLVGFADTVRIAFMGALGAATVFGTGFSALRLSASFESLRVRFGVLVQDMEEGEKVFKRIQKLAAETPLTTSNLADATSVLLQYDAATPTDIVATLRMIGDVSGGNAERMQFMARAYGQVAAAGRLMGQELLQMINAGFNPLKEISRTTGISMAKLKDMMAAGLITFDHVREAFRTATSEGGRFFQGMEKGAQTLEGRWSTFRDNIDIALARIGDIASEGLNLKEVLKDMSEATKDAADVFSVLFDGVKKGIAVIRQFVSDNKEAIRTIMIITGVLGAAAIAVKALTVAFHAVIFVLRLFKLNLIGMIVLHVITAAVIILTKVFVGLATVISMVVSVLSALITAVVGGNLVTAALIMAGIVAALGAAVLAFGALVSAMHAAEAAGRAMIVGFNQIRKTLLDIVGPAGKFMTGWENFFSDIVRSAQLEFDLLQRFVVAYFRLAVLQIQGLWTPLWKFLETSFSVVFDAGAKIFKLKFNAVWKEVKSAMAKAFIDAFLEATLGFTVVNQAIKQGKDIFTKQGREETAQAINEKIKLFRGEVEEGVGGEIEAVVNDMTAKLADAAAKLKDAIQNADMAGIEKAKQEIDALRTEAAAKEAEKAAKKAKDDAAQNDALKEYLGGFNQVEKTAKKVSDHVKEIRGVMAGTNESFQRIMDHQEMMREGRMTPRSSGNGMFDTKKSEELLSKIVRNTDPKNEKALKVQPANI